MIARKLNFQKRGSHDVYKKDEEQGPHIGSHTPLTHILCATSQTNSSGPSQRSRVTMNSGKHGFSNQACASWYKDAAAAVWCLCTRMMRTLGANIFQGCTSTSRPVPESRLTLSPYATRGITARGRGLRNVVPLMRLVIQGSGDAVCWYRACTEYQRTTLATLAGTAP